LVDEDLLFDCGTGSVKNLRMADVDLAKLRKVLITHYHLDHISDLAPLLWTLEMEETKEPLEIAGYKTIEKVTKKLLKLMNTPEDFTVFNLKFNPLNGNENFGEIQTFLTKHKPKNIAYRIQRGSKSLCYTGDTAFYKPLVRFVSNCNLLIHEATFLDEQKDIAVLTNHSTASQAGKIAKLANVEKLVLTHIFPGNDKFEDKYVKQAAKEFKGEIFVAKDFQTIDI